MFSQRSFCSLSIIFHRALCWMRVSHSIRAVVSKHFEVDSFTPHVVHVFDGCFCQADLKRVQVAPHELGDDRQIASCLLLLPLHRRKHAPQSLHERVQVVVLPTLKVRVDVDREIAQHVEEVLNRRDHPLKSEWTVIGGTH